jgi:hypothetical protein
MMGVSVKRCRDRSLIFLLPATFKSASERNEFQERDVARTLLNPGQPLAIASTPESVTRMHPLKFNPCNFLQLLATSSKTLSSTIVTSLKSRAISRLQCPNKSHSADDEIAVQDVRVSLSI